MSKPSALIGIAAATVNLLTNVPADASTTINAHIRNRTLEESAERDRRNDADSREKNSPKTQN